MNIAGDVIKGDNLQVLQHLRQQGKSVGEVKLAYLDPPYGMGTQRYGYDCRKASSVGSESFGELLEEIRNFLTEDGSIWVSIGKKNTRCVWNALAEVFYDTHFVDQVTWWYNGGGNSQSVRGLRKCTENILVFAKNIEKFKMNAILPNKHKNAVKWLNNNDGRGEYHLAATFQTLLGTHGEIHDWAVRDPKDGTDYYPPKGCQWRHSRQLFDKLIAEDDIVFNKGGYPRRKIFSHQMMEGSYPKDIWHYEEVGDTLESRREMVALNPSNVFLTAKPVALIHRIISLATNEGDTVLDPYAGSGTTGAACIQTKRNFALIEDSDYTDTHIMPRLMRDGSGMTGEDRLGLVYSEFSDGKLTVRDWGEPQKVTAIPVETTPKMEVIDTKDVLKQQLGSLMAQMAELQKKLEDIK